MHLQDSPTGIAASRSFGVPISTELKSWSLHSMNYSIHFLDFINMVTEGPDRLETNIRSYADRSGSGKHNRLRSLVGEIIRTNWHTDDSLRQYTLAGATDEQINKYNPILKRICNWRDKENPKYTPARRFRISLCPGHVNVFFSPEFGYAVQEFNYQCLIQPRKSLQVTPQFKRFALFIAQDAIATAGADHTRAALFLADGNAPIHEFDPLPNADPIYALCQSMGRLCLEMYPDGFPKTKLVGKRDQLSLAL